MSINENLDRIVMERLGELTMLDSRLHTRIVPTITVEEFAEAMKITAKIKSNVELEV
jgi:hypothetical protein